MNSKFIREKFLSFFRGKEHLILPSSSLVPDDPTMLLTTAGMVQLKPYFLGAAAPPKNRIATVQKCVRTTDVDEVGRTARHLTFFEMLGNFSFGDYYKREAIRWATEFLFETMGIEEKRMWVTVYKEDDEAHDIWSREIGFPESRIVRLGEEDNFWQAGPTGPCGPCSELIFDRGIEYGCGKESCAPGCDCDRFLEIWNLVFMQYDRNELGELTPLPRKNIDTGMGLERISMVLQDKSTVFDTDLLFPLIKKAADLSGKKFGSNIKTDLSLKIIADHVRCSSFLVGDGVFPSNEGRGYVLRRLVRRAVRHAKLLGVEEAFIPDVSKVVIENYGDDYQELKENSKLILEVLGGEERKFRRTLHQGIALLIERIEELKKDGIDKIPGKIIFELYDTYGFPPELTVEISSENGLQSDMEDFEKLLEKRREESRKSWLTKEFECEKEIYGELLKKGIKSDFIGHERDGSYASVLSIISEGREKGIINQGEEAEIVLTETPFYAESGGQVSDTGIIVSDEFEFEVNQVIAPLDGLIVHKGVVKKGKINVGSSVTAEINALRRRLIERNHTATHLLQWALRLVLGVHIKQSGSFVCDEYFRFDYPFERPITREEINKIEKLVNSKIIENHPVRKYETTLEHAREIGAIALFGEKYGNFVRVVEIGDFSRELCGGTHVDTTAELNIFKIVTERGIGAGMRRIEAMTSKKAHDLLFLTVSRLEHLAHLFKVLPEALEKKAKELLEELERTRKEASKAIKSSASEAFENLKINSEKVNNALLMGAIVEGFSLKELKTITDLAREKLDTFGIAIGSLYEGKPFLVVAISRDLASKGLSADLLVKEAAKGFSGGGGGTDLLAEAGGKNSEGLKEAINIAKEAIRDFIKSLA